MSSGMIKIEKKDERWSERGRERVRGSKRGSERGIGSVRGSEKMGVL